MRFARWCESVDFGSASASWISPTRQPEAPALTSMSKICSLCGWPSSARQRAMSAKGGESTQPHPCVRGRATREGAGLSVSRDGPSGARRRRSIWSRRRPTSFRRWSLMRSRVLTRRSRRTPSTKAVSRSRGDNHVAMSSNGFYYSRIMKLTRIAMTNRPGRDERPRGTGSCLCGSVRFSLHGDLGPVSYCHCIMCQRAMSHYGAFTACDPAAVKVDDPRRKLRWYQSSPTARRGFCSKCGSQLFWEPHHGRHTCVSAGSLDQPTGLRPGRHIHTDDVADYDRADVQAADGKISP